MVVEFVFADEITQKQGVERREKECRDRKPTQEFQECMRIMFSNIPPWQPGEERIAEDMDIEYSEKDCVSGLSR